MRISNPLKYPTSHDKYNNSRNIPPKVKLSGHVTMF